MKIPAKGIGEDELFEKLESFKKDDTDWKSGKMFGHAFVVNDETRRIIEKAFLMFLGENALDPTLFNSLLKIENEVVEYSRVHLNGDADVVGNFTSGGTESILLAVKAARDHARHRKPGIEKPEMIVPVTAHAAFHKAAEYFRVNKIMVPVDPTTYKADVNAIADAVTDNTVLIVASAPSYAHGVVDPIPKIGRLALEKDVLFHVDACMGGFLLPFFRKLGWEITEHDFGVPGVTSMSMDFHKYAFAAKGASVVLYRNKQIRRHAIFSCSDWTGYTLINPTVQSSRSGGPLAGTWAVLNYLGEEGYMSVAKKLKSATERIMAGIESIEGLFVLGKPEFCIFGVGAEGVNVFHIVDEMKLRGWHIQPQFGLGAEHKENFHLTVLPGNVDLIDKWIEDLRECVNIARSLGPGKLMERLKPFIEKPGDLEVSDEDIENIFKMLDVDKRSTPVRMAEINGILNSLPPKLADRMLTAYYNEVNRYSGSY